MTIYNLLLYITYYMCFQLSAFSFQLSVQNLLLHYYEWCARNFLAFCSTLGQRSAI